LHEESFPGSAPEATTFREGKEAGWGERGVLGYSVVRTGAACGQRPAEL